MPGRPSAVVTNPIAKSVLYRAGFRHPGHTEFLAELAANGGTPPQPVMMLWSPALAVVPVTIHLPLREAIAQLSSDLIVATVPHRGRGSEGPLRPRAARALRSPASIRMPAKTARSAPKRPDIVAPAVEILRRDGIDARGPLPADTMFHEAARKTYDCAICMYHDQALIPIKTIAFEDAVNVTLGLPFIRTSPDHGTAFDIAGTGKANPSSLIAALQLAARMVGGASQDERRSTTCRRCATSFANTPCRRANRSVRTSCSTSISPRGSRAPQVRWRTPP